MYLLYSVLVGLVKFMARMDRPGWGSFYKALVVRFVPDRFWAATPPRVIRDRITRMYCLLDLKEWADRLHFMLGRWYDLETQLVVEQILKPGDTVVDVGANYGNFSLASAALIGETGVIKAFEPNPHAFSRLQTNINMNRLSQVITSNTGLSDAPGKLSLSVPKHNPGEASFTEEAFSEFKTFDCPITTGDAEIGDQFVTLIKIDVEGFEVRVLQGLIKTITRDHPWIITEVNKSHLQRDGRVPTDLEDFLAPYGYTPFRIGTSGLGRRKILTLTQCALTEETESDVLWVPKPALNTLRSSEALVLHETRID